MKIEKKIKWLHLTNVIQKGMSFLEIMIVIVIMVSIAAIAGPKLIGILDESKVDTTKIQMKNLDIALKKYRLDNNHYPSTEQGLEALFNKPETGIIPKNWRGPYMDGKLPLDPWDNEYIYISNKNTFEIISYGSGGEEGGEGVSADISSND